MYAAMLHHPDARRLRHVVRSSSACPAAPRCRSRSCAASRRRSAARCSRATASPRRRAIASFNRPDRERKPGSIGTPGRGRRDEGSSTTTATRSPQGEVGRDRHPRPDGDEGLLGPRRRDGGGAAATAGSTPATWPRVDEDGYFFIVDRKKDMIIRGGFNVYPREIEEVLYEHPAVREAAVVGVPHESLGEEVGAAVALKAGEDARAERAARLHQGARGRLQVPAPGVDRRRAAQGPDGQDPQARDRGPGRGRRSARGGRRRRITLRDGARSMLRPIEPEDREALADGLRAPEPGVALPALLRAGAAARASATSTTSRASTTTTTRRSSRVDAGPATASASPGSCAPAPDEAEPAIVVADDWQGRGWSAGCWTRWPTARARRASALRGARAGRERRGDRGCSAAGRHDSARTGARSSWRSSLRPERAAGAARTLMRLLRVAAEGGLAPARQLLDRLAWRPRAHTARAVELAQHDRLPVGVERAAPGGAVVRRGRRPGAGARGSTVQVVARPAPAARQRAGGAGGAGRRRRPAARARPGGRRAPAPVDAAPSLVDVAAERNARLVIVGAAGPQRTRRACWPATSRARWPATRPATC